MQVWNWKKKKRIEKIKTKEEDEEENEKKTKNKKQKLVSEPDPRKFGRRVRETGWGRTTVEVYRAECMEFFLGSGSETKQNSNKEEEDEEEEDKTPSSLPSLRERSETPGALDKHTLGITGGDPVAQHRLSPSVRITGYRRSGCRRARQESVCVRSGPTPDSIIGEVNVQNPRLQANKQPRLPAQYLNPSRLEPVARAHEVTLSQVN